MRPRPRRRSAVLLVPLACACGWVGCNALAGIQEGVLAGDGGIDGSMDGASPRPDADSAVPSSDSPAGEAGSDASAPDAGSDSSGPPPVLACAIQPGSTVTVDDLSALGSGNLNFGSHVWVAARDANDSAYVLAQRQADTTKLFDYEVDFSQGTATPATYGGLGSSITLLDVASTGTTNEALAAYPSGSTDALEIIPLPFSSGTLAPAWALPNGIVPAGTFSGRLLHGVQQESYLALGAGSAYSLSAGEGTPDSGAVVSLSQTSSATYNTVTNAPFVSIGGTDYAVVGLAAGGSDELSYPANVSSAGTATAVVPNGTIGTVFGMQADPSNPNDVEAIALNVQGTSTIQLWGGSIPPTSLDPISIGPPQFTAGDTIALGDVPGSNVGTQWAQSEFFMIGPPGDNSGGLVLLWVGPTGHVVSRATTSGKLVTTTNTIGASAVLAANLIGELEATLVVAWIETVAPDGASSYQVLYAAEVTCKPVASGD